MKLLRPKITCVPGPKVEGFRPKRFLSGAWSLVLSAVNELKGFTLSRAISTSRQKIRSSSETSRTGQLEDERPIQESLWHTLDSSTLSAFNPTAKSARANDPAEHTTRPSPHETIL